MGLLKQLHTTFNSCFGRKKHPNSPEPPPYSSGHSSDNNFRSNTNANHDTEQSGGDNFGALTEVAAPAPVELVPEAEFEQRPSLEQRLSDSAKRLHDDDQGEYGSLSEVAAPEVVGRRSDKGTARHRFLEQSLYQGASG